ncbi:unnamed protein product [Mytilus coruscus]|uniref:Reverse transcriptase domain-containing protein n=1 Tax=Mytilus coruscus TaxID=42192 RepID=A0A6J8C6E2_MYTCO|nr:unnamed protein product [Mytilus coruscus]
MDTADVIQLTQRAIVLAGNAHYVYNTDRRKAMLVKTMPDSLDCLTEKKGQKALENLRNNFLKNDQFFSAGAHKQSAVCGRQTSSQNTSFREKTLAGKPVTEQTGEQLWSAPESAPEPDPEPNPEPTSEQPRAQETCKPIDRGKVMEFRSLPFGIAVAPIIFTKLIKVPMALLRRLGVRLIVYLDNILIMNQSNQKILSDLSTVLSILRGLGFMNNAKKYGMEPSQTKEFLGYTVNSKLLTLSLPKEKVEKIKNSSKLMLEHKKVSARDLAQLIRQLTATNQVVLPGPLHYRSLQILKTKSLHLGGHYDHQIQLNQEVQNELHWWITKLGSWNWKALLHEHHLTIKSVAKSVRIGSNISADKFRWALVRRGKIPPYKSARAKSSYVRSTVLCK